MSHGGRKKGTTNLSLNPAFEPRVLSAPGGGVTDVTLPPHDLDAEASVLGALMLDSAAITRVIDLINPEDFYRENNGQVYRAALSLHRAGVAIDNVTLADELEKMGVLDRVGNRAHMGELQDQTPTAANIAAYARIVRDKALKRRLIAAGKELARAGYDDAVDVAAGLTDAAAALHRLSVDAGEEHAPEVDRVGLGWRVRFQGGMVLTINHLRDHFHDRVGELTVEHAPDAEAPKHLYRAAFNVSDGRARAALAAHLRRRWPLDWDALLERFCLTVLQGERVASDLEEIGGAEEPDEPQEQWILDPIVCDGEPTLLYAPGGSGKSTIAAAVAVSVQTGIEVVPGWKPLSAPVLVLDWESRPDAWKRQIRAVARGCGSEPPRIKYLRMSRPLADELERVTEVVTEHGIGLVIIDSVEPASGSGGAGEGYNDRAERLFTAVRTIGTACLLIDHVRGDQLDADGPAVLKSIGGVRKRDRSRAMYELRPERQPTRDRIEVVLTDTKHNNRAGQQPIGLAMTFSDFNAGGRAQCIQFHKCKVSAPDLMNKLPLAKRMEALLTAGALHTDEIAKELGTSPGTIRNEVKRHPDRFTRLEDKRIGAASHV